MSYNLFSQTNLDVLAEVLSMGPVICLSASTASALGYTTWLAIVNAWILDHIRQSPFCNSHLCADGSGSDLEHTRSVNIEHWNSNMDLVHEDFQGDAVAAVLTGADCGAFGSEMAKDDDEREVHCINYTDDLKFNPPVPQPPDTPNHERAWNRF